MEKVKDQLSDDIDLLKSLLAEQALKLDAAVSQKEQLLAHNEQLWLSLAKAVCDKSSIACW